MDRGVGRLYKREEEGQYRSIFDETMMSPYGANSTDRLSDRCLVGPYGPRCEYLYLYEEQCAHPLLISGFVRCGRIMIRA